MALITSNCISGLFRRKSNETVRCVQHSAFIIALLLTTVLLGTFARPVRAADEDTHSGERAIREGKYEKSVKIFLDMLKLDKTNVRAQLGASLAYLKLQKYQDCFEHAQEVLGLDKNNARAHALIGLALLRSGYFSNAITEFEFAIEANSKEPLAWGGLSEVDYYNNRAKEARRKAYYAFTLDPSEADYLITYARASSRLEMFNEAADAYERYLEIAPKTDNERRERILGLIQFYRKLVGIHLHQISGPKDIEIPFKLGSDRRPYIQVRVNGQDATFVLDTGSGFTVISETAAKRLGIAPVAKGGTSQGVGGNGKFPIVYGLIDSLYLEDEKIAEVPCFIRPFHEDVNRPREFTADGFIGLSVLSSFLTSIDYKQGSISLDRDNAALNTPPPASPDVTVIPFRTTENGLISVETQLDGEHLINAILDTGASSTVVSMAAVKRLDLSKSIIKGQTVRVVGAAGISNDVELLHLRNCQVADLQQNNLRALVLDFGAINETSGFEQSGIIGGDFLVHFRLTIDFIHGQLALQPQTPSITRLQPPPKLTSMNLRTQ